MSDDREVLLEVGPPGTGALPVSLMISMKPGHHGTWDLEIAVDTTRPVQAVLVAPDGAAGVVHPLTPTQTGAGQIHYATVQVQLAGPGLIVEILGPDQLAVEELSTYVRPDRQRSVPLARIPPGPDPRPSGWGPPGAQRWESAVQLIGAWRSELGIVLDVLVDDAGKASRMNASARPGGSMEQAWLAPQQMALIAPSLARVWLPAGTREVDLAFYGGNGDQIEEYRQTLSLDNLPVADPLIINMSPPRPAPRMGSLLGTGGRYQAAPETGMHEPVQAPPPSFPARPSYETPSPVAAIEPAPEPGAPLPMQPPPPSRAPAPASRPSGATSRPSGAYSRPGTAARDLAKARRRTGKMRVPVAWPDSIGTAGRAMGPDGPLSGKPILGLVAVIKRPDVTELEFFLDDQGLVASIAVAGGHGILTEVPLPRITTFSPARARVEVPAGDDQLVLFCRNPYGEVYPNLSTGIDVHAQEFKPVSLDRESWEEHVQFAAPLSLDESLCCVCRRDVLVHQAVLLSTLTPDDRNQLRADYALTPDARALCTSCHEEHILSRQWLHLLVTAFSGPNLKLGAVRLVHAYAGAMLLLTPVGRLVSQILLIAFAPRVDERYAMSIASGVLAFGVAVLPWPAVWVSVAQGWRTLLRSGRVVGAQTFGVPVVLLLLGWAAQTSAVPLPEWYAREFYKLDLHIAVGTAFLLALLVVLIIERTIDWVYEGRLQAQRKMVQLGHAARLVPRLLNVADMLEFDRAIDRVLMEGFGALEYQVFALHADAKKFRLKRAVGPLRHQVSGLDFRSGDPHRLGMCAQMGRPLTQAEVAADKEINAAALHTPIPSLAVIPVWVRGEVAEIYNISRMRGVGLTGDLPGLMGMLTVVAGRGLTDMIKNAEAAERAAQEGKAPANVTTSRH